MGLPTLDGEVRLSFNDAATKNIVSAIALAEQALTHVQSTAQATDQALSKIGGNGALKNFVSAVAPAEDALTQVQTSAATTDAALSSIGQNANVGTLTSQLGALATEEELTAEEAQRLQTAFAELAQAQGLTPLVAELEKITGGSVVAKAAVDALAAAEQRAASIPLALPTTGVGDLKAAQQALIELRAQGQETVASLSNIKLPSTLQSQVDALKASLGDIGSGGAAEPQVNQLVGALDQLVGEEAGVKQLQNVLANLVNPQTGENLTSLVTKLEQLRAQATQAQQSLSAIQSAPQTAPVDNQVQQRLSQAELEIRQRKAQIAGLAEVTGLSERQITAIVDTESKRHVGITAEEIAQRKAIIAQLAAATGASEKQITAQIESEISKRNGGGGAGLNIGNLLAQGAAAAGIALTVRAIASEAVELDTLGVKAERVSQAFVVLSGGADQAKARLEAVQRATGGAVTELDAMQAANRAATLGLGKSADELERVTRLLSTANRAQGNGEDIGSSLEQFSQTVANQSARGLARLGINAGEVKDRVEQLKFTMAGATKEEIFLQAALDVGEKTFQGFGDGAVTSASGMEILKTRIENLKNKVAELINLDGATRNFLAIFGDQNIGNQIKVAQDAAQKFATGNNIGSALTGPNQDQATRFTELSLALKSADEAQRRGLPGAEAYAKGVQDAATSAERLGLVTDGNAQSITELVTKYGQGTTAAQIFQAAQGKRLETGAIDELKAKIDDLKGRQAASGGFLGAIVGKVDQGQIDQLEGALHKALENAGKNLPITFENPDLTKALPDLAGKLPDGKPLDDLTAATDRAKNATDLLAVAQQGLASGVITQQQLAQVQAQNQVAQADLGVAEAKRVLATATGAYVASLTSTDQKTKDAAQADVDAAAKAENLAEKRQAAAGAAQNLANAQAQLAQAQASGNGEDAALLQTTVSLAQANKQAADSAVQLAAGQGNVSATATESADAWKAYESAIREIQSTTIGMIDAQSGLPVAFNSATTSGAQLSTVLQQLARDERNLASSAAASSFALGASLAPQLGVAGALQQGNQFRQQAASIVSDFNQINTAREQAGQAPFGNEVLQASLSNLGAYQQAYVSDMQNAGDAAEKAGSRQEKAFDKANKAVSSALDSIIAGVVKPTTGGLLEGAGLKQSDLDALLPREDAIDERARRLADVAVKGFKSPFIGQFKDIIPPDIFAAGELAIRKFAATKVRLNTEGLDTDLLDIDKATNKVLEKIQGKQKTDQFIQDIEQRVKGLAPTVGITDIKSALGIETQAEEIGGAVSTGVKSALAGVLNFDQIRTQLNAALTGTGATGESPLTAGLTIKEADKTKIVASGKTATTETGEAAVAQMETGQYGARMVGTITAQVAAKKGDAEKSGKDLADWLGGSLLTNFKDKVPAGLLSILTDKLVPLIQAAQAAQNERTVGAGVAP